MKGMLWMISIFSLVIHASTAGNITPLEFIENGNPRTYNEVPYLATVYELKSGLCSGILISESWVLTTQYCLQTSVEDTSLKGLYSTKLWRVEVGRDILQIPYEEDIFEVKRFIPRYSSLISTQKLSNIVLIELVGKVNTTRVPKFASIGHTDLQVGDQLEATGVGNPEDSDDATNFTSISVTIQEPSACRLLHWREIELKDSPLLCGKFKAGQTVNAGDPGGPLYQRLNDNQAKVYGLITGDSSHDPNFFSFVNLEYHINWIAHTTGISKETLRLSSSHRFTVNYTFVFMILLILAILY
ncbi:Serine protease 27 [Basidiobolus ranarum]|uniref:Serine protease 27 n=1 Tax=Basidiobolus ranarum TaxID=34480 RepID=A0ABR2WYS1_9FUNG